MSNTAGGGPGIPPGWYKDAQGTTRWWDGTNWTEQIQPGGPPPPYGQPTMSPAVPAGAGRHGSGPSGAKPWYQKRRWQVGGAVFAVFVVAGIIGGGEDSSTPVAAASDVRPAEASAPPSSTPTPTPSAAVESASPAAAPSKSATPKPTPKPTPTPKPAPAAMPVSAVQMLKEFEGNEAAADAKYKGKTLRVTGVAVKVDTEFWDDSQYVIEINGGGAWAFLTVNCNDVTAPVAARVQVHHPITVVGTFDDGGDLGVELKNCTVA